jgi:AcrR family transcriptional regulator
MAREHLLHAALTRFATSGYAATSMRDIAGDVGIKAPSIYAHFPNKRAMYEAAYEYSIQQHQAFFIDLVAESEDLSPLERLRALLFGVPEFYRAHPDLANFHLRAAADLSESGRGNQPFLDDENALAELVTTVYMQGRDNGDLKPLDPDMVTTVFLTLADGLFLQLAYYDDQTYTDHQHRTWEGLAALLTP